MDNILSTYLRQKVLRLTGIDLYHYKDTQMQRRLAAFLQQSGYSNWPAFFRDIQNAPARLAGFKNYLGINVSSFFRDPDKYDYLRDVVLPELLHGHPSLRVWSAGCAGGHEPYSLAIALAEATNDYRPHRVIATDIDGAALEQARAGGPYTADEVAPMPATLRERYLARQDDKYWLNNTRVRRKVIFAEHNLLADPFLPPGGGPYDLVVCRNVVIYFTAEGKRLLYQRLRETLRPGGVLFIGGTEMISNTAALGLEALGMSFYRREE